MERERDSEGLWVSSLIPSLCTEKEATNNYLEGDFSCSDIKRSETAENNNTHIFILSPVIIHCNLLVAEYV